MFNETSLDPLLQGEPSYAGCGAVEHLSRPVDREDGRRTEVLCEQASTDAGAATDVEDVADFQAARRTEIPQHAEGALHKSGEHLAFELGAGCGRRRVPIEIVMGGTVGVAMLGHAPNLRGASLARSPDLGLAPLVPSPTPNRVRRR